MAIALTVLMFGLLLVAALTGFVVWIGFPLGDE